MTSSIPFDPKLGAAFQPGQETDESVALAVALLDLQDKAPAIRRLRDWALAKIQLQPGEAALDVGSGTGTIVRELATLVGSGGRAIGVEPNPRLRSLAVERAATSPNAQFVDGHAGSLPFADDSVDLVWCERVLQHLTDPQAAITDFFRVLRPGGRALLLDSDHASRVTSDLDHDLEARILNAFLDALPNGRAARLIPRQAITAGFEIDPDIGSAGLVMPLRIAPGAPTLIEVAARAAVQSGAITAAEADQAIHDLNAAVEAGWAFSSVTVFGFLLTKPGPTLTSP